MIIIIIVCNIAFITVGIEAKMANDSLSLTDTCDRYWGWF